MPQTRVSPLDICAENAMFTSKESNMIEFIIRFFQSLTAQPQRDELLIPVRVDEKKPLHKRR
jgi:hypothetical protein